MGCGKDEALVSFRVLTTAGCGWDAAVGCGWGAVGCGFGSCVLLARAFVSALTESWRVFIWFWRSSKSCDVASRRFWLCLQSANMRSERMLSCKEDPDDSGDTLSASGVWGGVGAGAPVCSVITTAEECPL